MKFPCGIELTWSAFNLQKLEAELSTPVEAQVD